MNFICPINKIENKEEKIEKIEDAEINAEQKQGDGYTEQKNVEQEIQPKDIWKMLNELLPPLNIVVAHQLESYNNFIKIEFENTFKMFNPICVRSEKDFDINTKLYSLEMYVSFDNMHILRPQIYENNGSTKILFPQEARKRNCTYASQITMDIRVKYVARQGEFLEQISTHYKTFPNYNICNQMPIMVLSDFCELKNYPHLNLGECNKDIGGYFIIKGSEKVILAQERGAENVVQCYNILNQVNNTKYSWKAEIKCIPSSKLISPKQVIVYISKVDDSLLVSIPRIKIPIPLFILFRALGVISDLDICNHIILSNEQNDKTKLLQNELNSSIVAASNYLTQESAFNYIMGFASYTYVVPFYLNKDSDKESASEKNTKKELIKKMRQEIGIPQKIQFTKTVLENDLFIHCSDMSQRTYFLGYMVCQLLKTKLKWIEPGDRDSYKSKRIDTTGFLLNKLLVNQVNKIKMNIIKYGIKEIDNGVWKSTNNFTDIMNFTNIDNFINSSIEAKIIRALNTGDFSIAYNSSDSKVGVAQLLNRLTDIAYTSHLRRISRSIDKNGKLVEPRKLHPSSWGFICPYETPEGQSVGIVNNMSVMTHFTIQTSVSSLQESIAPFITTINEFSTSSLVADTHPIIKVILNGAFIGVVKHTENPVEVYHALKKLKYQGIINVFTSIYYDYFNMEICICSVSGRCTRPLFRVKNGKLLFTHKILQMVLTKQITWADLCICGTLGDSVIEYIDASEQNCSVIATRNADLCSGDNSNAYTHCEIDPCLIFGMTASCIPFSGHNQSPRIVYQCAQVKQAMSVFMNNFYNRHDKTFYVLNYPTKPLVETQLMNIFKFNENSSGCMITVAIMCYDGYNQEDSILINQGSIDRGMFQSTIYHSEKDEDKTKNEIRGIPDVDKTEKIKMGDYSQLNSDGFIPKDSLVPNRSVIMAKVSTIKEKEKDGINNTNKYTDKSILLKTCGEEVFIDENILDTNGSGYLVTKVKTRATRKPVIGDKFSSRHGQKGTCGRIIPEQNMPFSASGERPDIIVNAHAFPSRMTIGQFLECGLGKILVELGLFGDGTCFNDTITMDWICKKLLSMGYEAHGNELLYSGETGQQMNCSVFMGPTFYQRLKHMVNDKQHARSTGPPVALTRQPAEGRSRGGGLRVGEMERDCIGAHGAATLMHERLYVASDKYKVHVCNECGLIAAYNDKKHIHLCNTCSNRTNFSEVKIPYACKLLFQELAGMNVIPRIITTDSLKL